MAKKARARFSVWATALALIALALGAVFLVRGDLRQIREENRHLRGRALVRTFAADVQRDLIDKPTRGAAELAQCEAVGQVLADRADADGPALLAALSIARRLLGATSVFYLDQSGIIAACAAPGDREALRRSDVSSHSYARSALAGRPTTFVGVGDPTGRPGIYHALPARLSPDMPPMGAIVIKIEAPDMAATLGQMSVPVLLESPSGALLASNRWEWLARTSEVNASTTSTLPATLATASLPFDPRGQQALLNGAPYHLVREPVGDSGWTLVGLVDASAPAPLTPAQQRHVITRAGVLVLAGLMIVMLVALITRRTRLENTLRESHARVEAANRAKDGFLALLSHELRTPLTPVLARVSQLERETDLSESMREAITMIRRNIETEARLIDDLLDLTRADSGKLALEQEVVDVHALAENVAAMFQDEARDKQLALTTDLRAPRHHVKGDTHRLQQVLWNLLSNAIKFTPSGGQVRIAVCNEGPSSDTLRIDVCDTGKGIDPQICAHLFAPFEQGGGHVTREFGGLGLGLAISKTLVDAHHGTLSSSSDGLGHGATFTIRLAALDLSSIPTAQPLRAPQAPPIAAPGPRMRILLVEDHADTRRVLERLLSDMGHTVTAAASMLDALNAARTSEFDLVLSDLGLPDGSGTDLLRRLRQDGQPNVRAISISGFGSESDIANSRAAGFTAHLTKPVGVEQIEQVLAASSPP